jgi:hypothetical protein
MLAKKQRSGRPNGWTKLAVYQPEAESQEDRAVIRNRGRQEYQDCKRALEPVIDELVATGLEAERIYESPEEKFNRLRDEWKKQRGHEPSTIKAILLPPYQKIIGMGSYAIPLLLQELSQQPDNWFWALMAITENDPVTEEIRGDGTAMAQAWLKWGEERGYKR